MESTKKSIAISGRVLFQSNSAVTKACFLYECVDFSWLWVRSIHGQLKLRPYFLPWVSKNRRYVSTIQSLFWILFTWILLFFNLTFDFSLLKIEIEIWKKNHVTGWSNSSSLIWAVTRLCRPTGYGDYLWASRPMFSAVGLFLGLKSKISHEQNVIYFQFYIRLPNCRLLGTIIFKKSPIRSIPLSILYRLFFETQGRKYGRILSWSWSIFYH